MVVSVRAVRPAFTIADLMVSMTVIAILIGLLMPTIWSVRETARRVICGSNIRQLGIGIALYADDHEDRLPSTQFVGDNKAQEMLRVRVEKGADAVNNSDWDGLGWLYEAYLPESHVFYCPSHTGGNTFEVFSDRWANKYGRIICNYQFRGMGPNKETRLSLIDPNSSALVADGLRTRADFNHRVGGNVLRADLSVFWYRDSGGHLMSVLPFADGNAGATQEAWKLIDDELLK